MADLKGAGPGGTSPVRRRLAFDELIQDPEQVMGVKAVFGRLTSRVMCFGGRGTPEQHGRYYQAARIAAERAASGQRFLVTIGGGDDVPDELRRRLLNVAVVSGVYGKTDAFLTDPEERRRLAQWPTAVALNDVWEFEDLPQLIDDLGFPDGRILENAFDSVIRPEERVARLVTALCGWMLVLKDLPPVLDFRDKGKLALAIAQLPHNVAAEEGKRLALLSTRLERDRDLVAEVKEINRAVHGGLVTCEGCGFADATEGYLDAHHLVPLAIEVRTSTAQDFAVLCPTCHRVVHRRGASKARPLPVADLRAWWKGRTSKSAVGAS